MTRSGYLLDLVVFFGFGGAAVSEGAVQPGAIESEGAQLKAILYRRRDAFASALGEYDQACRQHDAEMDGIRQACLAKWGKAPLLETYRQMAVRQQKAHDYTQALWWAERGIAI